MGCLVSLIWFILNIVFLYCYKDPTKNAAVLLFSGGAILLIFFLGTYKLNDGQWKGDVKASFQFMLMFGFMNAMGIGLYLLCKSWFRDADSVLGLPFMACGFLLARFFGYKFSSSTSTIRIPTIKKKCSKCGTTVSLQSRKGGTCPNCGAYWSDEI